MPQHHGQCTLCHSVERTHWVHLVTTKADRESHLIEWPCEDCLQLVGKTLELTPFSASMDVQTLTQHEAARGR